MSAATAKRLTTAQAWAKLNSLEDKDMTGSVIRMARVAANDYSPTFLQGMADRMAVSHFKYGDVKKAYGKRVESPLDALATLKKCLDAYAVDGNTEHLMDGANYLMIEFMEPLHPDAHFTPTDAGESVGRVKQSGAVTFKKNADL